jgi:agmatinase
MNGFINNLFTGANTPYDKARYVIFGVPFDSTTSFRAGTRQGPRAIRELSYNFETYIPSYDIDFCDIPVADIGDLDVNVVPDDVVMEVESVVKGIVNDKKVPVMLGGEHSITTGAVRAVRPDCFVVCDAHLDLREEFRGSVYNHACNTRRVYEDGIRDIIIIGGRSGTKEQFAFAQDHLLLYTADIVRTKGIAQVLREIKKRIAGKRVYLSIDADVIDSCLTPGLGTPEPFGLFPQDIREIIAVVAPHAVAFDYVEVCPAYDNGQAATVGAQMVREFIAAHAKSNI